MPREILPEQNDESIEKSKDWAQNLAEMPLGGMVRAKFRGAEAMNQTEKDQLDIAETQVQIAKWARDPESFKGMIHGLAETIADCDKSHSKESLLVRIVDSVYAYMHGEVNEAKGLSDNDVVKYYEQRLISNLKPFIVEEPSADDAKNFDTALNKFVKDCALNPISKL